MMITIWSGLVLGAIYAMVSFGFTLSLLPSGIFNFAQGAIIVAGIYLVYQFIGVDKIGLIPMLLVNAVIGIILGLACELLCVRPLRRGGGGPGRQQNELVTTVGLSTAIVGLIGIKWGYPALYVPFDGPTKTVHFLGIFAQPDEISLVAGAFVLGIGFHTWFHVTRWGQACLAIAEDREAATLRGINVNVLSLAGFAAAGLLGTISAVAIGPIEYAVPTDANSIALGGFVAIALGGQTNFLGALTGAMLVGLTDEFAQRYIGGYYGDVAVLILLLLTLAVRPTGLGGGAEARSV
jgi:branched-chain amino acid transport system permease protein